MSKVIVLEPTSLVLKETEKFGKLVYISNIRFNIFNIEALAQKINSKLKEIDYNPLDDLICLTGNAQKVALFLGVVASRYSEFIVLIFDNTTNKYKQRVFKNDNND